MLQQFSFRCFGVFFVYFVLSFCFGLVCFLQCVMPLRLNATVICTHTHSFHACTSVFKVRATMSHITIKWSLSGVFQHAVTQPRRIKEKVDYIILKASPILPHFIKVLSVKYLQSLHSSLWFYEAIKPNGNFFNIAGLRLTFLYQISENCKSVCKSLWLLLL